MVNELMQNELKLKKRKTACDGLGAVFTGATFFPPLAIPGILLATGTAVTVLCMDYSERSRRDIIATRFLELVQSYLAYMQTQFPVNWRLYFLITVEREFLLPPELGANAFAHGCFIALEVFDHADDVVVVAQAASRALKFSTAMVSTASKAIPIIPIISTVFSGGMFLHSSYDLMYHSDDFSNLVALMLRTLHQICNEHEAKLNHMIQNNLDH